VELPFIPMGLPVWLLRILFPVLMTLSALVVPAFQPLRNFGTPLR